MAVTNKLFPVTVPTWPTCNDCLTWSEDDLAIAGGEIVYILTPKVALLREGVTGHPQWHILNLRINLFSDSEWPEIDLATIRDLSIGEEQSSSHAVAIAWSPPGIGMHRRSVLGVLTSNLLLSLWETDGTQSNYHRTLIVNDLLAARSLPGNDVVSRRSQRIRSFAWLPALKSKASSRWGLHYIVVADDSGNITFLRVKKESASSLGRWSVSIELQIDHGNLDASNVDSSQMSLLQKRLQQQSPITKITVTPWTELGMSEEGHVRDRLDAAGLDTDSFLSTCTFTNGMSSYTTSICASLSRDGESLALATLRDSQDYGPSSVNLPTNQASKQSADSNTKEQTIPIGLPESYFTDAIRPLSENFDQLFQLSGFVRTRFWGATMSADGRKAAACITLHPSDMIEYSIPSIEKCTVIFKNVKKANVSTDSIPESPRAVRTRLLQFISDQIGNGVGLSSLLDAKLLSVYLKVVSLASGVTSEMKSLFEQVRSHQALNNGYSIDDSEKCEICDMDIKLGSVKMEATCSSGHQFSRCHITFLAIQEPGISKYCSKCGKEFLDLVKLDPTRAMSTGLTQTMFDEFDVCPYCQGKFRG